MPANKGKNDGKWCVECEKKTSHALAIISKSAEFFVEKEYVTSGHEVMAHGREGMPWHMIIFAHFEFAEEMFIFPRVMIEIKNIFSILYI